MKSRSEHFIVQVKKSPIGRLKRPAFGKNGAENEERGGESGKRRRGPQAERGFPTSVCRRTERRRAVCSDGCSERRAVESKGEGCWSFMKCS